MELIIIGYVAGRSSHKSRLHEHQVPNPDSNLDHNPHGRGRLSLDLNPVCLHVNTTNLDQEQGYIIIVDPAIFRCPFNFHAFKCIGIAVAG